MIYLLLFLDILINNFTNYTSYFFIIYLYNKPYKYFLLTGLILDFIILESLFLNTILLSIIYIINKVFQDLNKSNLYNYIFINVFNFLLFIILSNLLFSSNLSRILIILGHNFLINLIFYCLTYRTCNTK